MIFKKDIEALEARDNLEKHRIKESISERDALLGFTEDGNNQSIDEATLNQIKLWTNKLYYLASTGTEMTTRSS